MRSTSAFVILALVLRGSLPAYPARFSQHHSLQRTVTESSLL